MNTQFKIAIGAAMLIASSAASAEADIIATSSMAKGGGAVAVDLLTDGQTVNFQARLKITDDFNAKVNTAKCLASLPSTHKGTCVYNKDGTLFILAYSLSNTALPKGHLALGQVSVSGQTQAKVEVIEFLAADANNKAVNVSSRVGSDSRK